jgi:transcription-repair coupling factor (superfamily II helicase)
MIVAAVAVAIAEALGDDDVVYLADDEQQAEALASALGAIVTNPVIHLASSDALPGDSAPPSPANIGRRVAALQRLRRVQGEAGRAHLACILSGEASAQRYAAPSATRSTSRRWRGSWSGSAIGPTTGSTSQARWRSAAT